MIIIILIISIALLGFRRTIKGIIGTIAILATLGIIILWLTVNINTKTVENRTDKQNNIKKSEQKTSKRNHNRRINKLD